MKIKILMLFFFLTAVQLAAQDNFYSPFQASLAYPIGTNGIKSKEYTNGVSINLLLGISKNERYLTIGGLSNIISNNAVGMQLAGISNHIGGTGYGCAIAGVANITDSSYKGVQVSGIWNASGNKTAGVMLSCMGNFSKGDFNGLQFSGLINIAQDVDGLQFSGLLNKAQKVRGVQFATILNIAEESNCPIGLINIIKKGEMGLAVTYDILGNTVLSFRSGGKYTYGILGFGINHKIDNDKTVAEAGYGVHIPIKEWFRIDNEVKVSNIGSTTDKSILNASYLLAPSFKLWNHFNVFGGASINYITSKSAALKSLVPGKTLWNKTKGNREQYLYLGYQVGIQYIF